MELKIKHDDDPTSPREGDNLGLMVCWHNRHKLGDIQPDTDPKSWFKEHLPPEYLAKSAMMPIYMLDHSGLTISTKPFTCPWDSGQIGWIYTSPELIKREYGDCSEESLKKVRKVLLDEIKLYDQYLRGSVWGFEYGDDSCWGFFGDELEETGLEHFIPPEARPQLVEAWEARC